MRNYVIINNTNSLTKTGLAIKELPPISKPAMRTLTEDINGRDGDQITKLGYAAYDKTFEIGLFGAFDINEIISFFNQEGKITFSNEPDKFYNFQTLNQIDYNSLIKFKTASVTIHCQPFKYELGETAQTLTTGDNTVRNKGNIYSKPIITIEGSDEISVSLNGSQSFSIDLSETDKIEIDIEKLEAYDPDTGELLNRLVTGDYDDFKLLAGNNTINLSGTITEASIKNISRWL